MGLARSKSPERSLFYVHSLWLDQTPRNDPPPLLPIGSRVSNATSSGNSSVRFVPTG